MARQIGQEEAEASGCQEGRVGARRCEWMTRDEEDEEDEDMVMMRSWWGGGGATVQSTLSLSARVEWWCREVWVGMRLVEITRNRDSKVKANKL